jgi:hypothetical protein
VLASMRWQTPALDVEAVLELLDAVLTLAAIDLESEAWEAPPAQLVTKKRRLVSAAMNCLRQVSFREPVEGETELW